MARNCCRYFTVSLVPVASLTLAVLFGLAIVALPVLYVELAKEYKYGIIADAGSSHTDMFFYRWSIPRYRDTGEIEEIYHCNSSKSLSSYASDPSSAGEVVQRCLNRSEKRSGIPHSQRSNTELYLGATAGMRLVYCQNKSLSEEIMSTVNSTLNRSPYNLVSGRIITGQEEAVAGWITGNSLSRLLKHNGDTLVGSLDLGGASVEIAFRHEDPPSNHDQHYQTNVTLYERNYTLYARSYLCYGLNEARHRFLAYLINTNKTANKSQAIPNPCMLSGANLTYHSDHIYTECTRQTCSGVFATGFSPPALSSWEEEEEIEFNFTGSGNFTQCREIIEELFDLTNCSRSGECEDKDYFWPPVNNSGTFLGMSAFFTVADFFNQSHMEVTDLSNFISSVVTFCQLTNNTASRTYPNNFYLQLLCFDGVFSLFLLETGFGFNSSNSDWTLQFVDKVNKKTSVGWAMGYLMQQTTHIPDSPHHTVRPFQSVDLAVGILVLAILCVVFIIFFFLTFHACRKVLRTRGGYTNIS